MNAAGIVKGFCDLGRGERIIRMQAQEEERRLSDLQKKISEKRELIAKYKRSRESLGAGLTNANLICGSLAGAITGGMATLSTKAGANVHALMPLNSFDLLGTATLLSLVAAIANGIYQKQEISSRLSKVEAADAKLEGLDALVLLGQVTSKDAVAKYNTYIEGIGFLPSNLSQVRAGDPSSVTGNITLPAAGDSITRLFTCSGTVQHFVPGLHHLWLAIEIDGYSGIWPKEREIPVEGESWSIHVEEKGTSSSIILALYVTDAKAHKYIRNWKDKCDRDGVYPRLMRSPGMVRIHSVNVEFK